MCNHPAFFAGATWGVTHGIHSRNQTASFCQRGKHQLDCPELEAFPSHGPQGAQGAGGTRLPTPASTRAQAGRLPGTIGTAAGWEKGQVESQVGNVREWLFTPRLRFAGFAELNAWLAVRCHGLAGPPAPRRKPTAPWPTAFAEERPLLRPATAAFDGYMGSRRCGSPAPARSGWTATATACRRPGRARRCRCAWPPMRCASWRRARRWPNTRAALAASS